jgi:hypothetical protein
MYILSFFLHTGTVVSKYVNETKIAEKNRVRVSAREYSPYLFITVLCGVKYVCLPKLCDKRHIMRDEPCKNSLGPSGSGVPLEANCIDSAFLR